MFRTVAAGLIVMALALPTVIWAQQDQQTKTPDVTIKDVAKYLDKLDLQYELDEANNVARLPIAGDNGNFNIAIVADTDIDVVYIAVLNYLKVPPKHRNCDKVLRRMMELNWKFNIGKFEWDPTDGEVRVSYAVCTDNGLGFETFSAALVTVVQQADDHYPELKKLLDSE